MGEKKQIRISVKDKIACLVDKEQFLVCGNNDYEVVFDFDSDWEGISAKTAVFVYGNTPVHKPFVGNVCEGIEIKNATLCAVGVFAGDIKTTTGATIECRQSIRDIGGVPKPPTKEVYDEIMALLDKAIEAHTELPVGGKAGQVLKKVSDKDYDTEWANDEQRDLTEIEKNLGNKLDKTTEANKIYGTDVYGGQATFYLDDFAKRQMFNPNFYTVLGYGTSPEERTFILSGSATPNSVVYRDGNGNFKVNTPVDDSNPTPKGYVDKVKAQTEALEDRVADLENLTLSYSEDTSIDYEKAVPADVGAPARVKMIGGATEKVFSKNILNPKDIGGFYTADSEIPISYTLNADGTITYTLGDSGYCSFTLQNFPIGRYYLYAENASLQYIDEYGNIEIGLQGDWTPDNPVASTRILKVMVWQDTSVTTDAYEIVEAPEGTVFEPYHEPYFQDAEVERIESIGAQLIPFPYREKSKTMNGVTFTVQEDGGLKVLGTATGTANFFFYSGAPTMFTVGKTYSKSGDVTISVVKTDGTTKYLYGTFEWLAEYEKVTIYVVYANQEVDVTVYPMINVGSKLSSYKPYSAEPIDSIAIPVEAIKARVSGYGESVSNTYYGAERSVYNTINFVDKTVEYHQNKSKEKSLSGNTDWWNINRESEDCISFYFPKSQTSPKMKETESAVIDCIGLPIKLWVGGTLNSEHFWFSTSSYGICVSKSTLAQHGQLTDDTAKKNAFGAWLNAKYDSGNPIKIAYELATPVVTDITDLFTEGNKLQVQQGGAIRFVNEKKMAVPNTVAFIKRKE